jgi:hypothetical protein
MIVLKPTVNVQLLICNREERKKLICASLEFTAMITTIEFTFLISGIQNHSCAYH